MTDRFHLLQNLAEALDQVFTMHGQVLNAVNAALRQQPVPLSDGKAAVPVSLASTPTPAQQRAAQRQARRQATYDQVWTLHRQGWTVRAIAQQVGISQRTVQRDLQTATFVGRQRRSDRGRSLLDPYKGALLERWNAGCHTAARLFPAPNSVATPEVIPSSPPMPAGCVRPRAWPLDNAARGRRYRSSPNPRIIPSPRAVRPGSCSGARSSARQQRRSSSQRCAPSRPRSLRPSTWPGTLPGSCASGSLSSSIPGWSPPPPVRWRLCNASPRSSAKTMTRSKSA